MSFFEAVSQRHIDVSPGLRVIEVFKRIEIGSCRVTVGVAIGAVFCIQRIFHPNIQAGAVEDLPLFDRWKMKASPEL